MFKTFYSTSDWRNDPFFLEHWLFWIQSNFQATKKKQTCQIKMLYTEQTFAPRAFHSALQQQTNTVNTQKSPPWACDKGCAEACAERFSALKTRQGIKINFSHDRGEIGTWIGYCHVVILTLTSPILSMCQPQAARFKFE